jgi:argininosuccinate lyase
LFLNQNFNFMSFPDSLTTGSSIMPHKKNPDVFELIRAKCNRMKALPNEILMMTTNLPSGYHRDLQILKEHLFPAFNEIQSCLKMAVLMLEEVIVRDGILDDQKYEYLFSVEEVNRLVMDGVPFRDAYRKVGESISKGQFQVTSTKLSHTHEGSLGNLSLTEIRQKMDSVVSRFSFSKVKDALIKLRS